MRKIDDDAVARRRGRRPLRDLVTRGVRRIARLPIRVRLTLISTLATAILFGALGALLYFQFQSSVNASIDSALRARAAELSVLGERSGSPAVTSASAPGTEAAFAQLLTPSGRVLDGTAGYRTRSLLASGERQRALVRPLLVDRHERARLYARRAADGNLIVVGVTLAQQQEAFITFNWELLAGMPVMLVIAAVVTYLVGGKLLAPVDRMRRQAAAISTDQLNSRLALPESVDEIHHLATTLNAMLDRLHEGVERELTFVGDASHELRTPLAVLRGELEVALRVDGSRAAYRAAAESAIEETDRLILLAESLLTVARAQDGSLPLSPVPISACELLDRVAQRARSVAAGVIVVDCSADSTIVVDPSWIEQALLNLVANARRYGGDGAITLYSVVRVGEIQLHVRDRGEGFPDSLLPHAFERFSRGDVSRARGGTGLGLSIVETIARAHGGNARAINRVDGGADVSLSLPADNASDTAPHDGAPASSPAASSVSSAATR